MPVSKQHTAVKELMERMNIRPLASNETAQENEIPMLDWFTQTSEEQVVGYTLWGMRRWFYSQRNSGFADWKSLPLHTNILTIQPRPIGYSRYQEWFQESPRTLHGWLESQKQNAAHFNSHLEDNPSYMSGRENSFAAGTRTFGLTMMWSDSAEHPIKTQGDPQEPYYAHYRANTTTDSYWFDAHTPPMRRTMNFVSIFGKVHQRMAWVKYHNDGTFEINTDSDAVLATEIGDIIATGYNSITQPVTAPNGLTITIRKPERKDNVTTTS